VKLQVRGLHSVEFLKELSEQGLNVNVLQEAIQDVIESVKLGHIGVWADKAFSQ
jgi:hypothetical protein